MNLSRDKLAIAGYRLVEIEARLRHLRARLEHCGLSDEARKALKSLQRDGEAELKQLNDGGGLTGLL